MYLGLGCELRDRNRNGRESEERERRKCNLWLPWWKTRIRRERQEGRLRAWEEHLDLGDSGIPVFTLRLLLLQVRVELLFVPAQRRRQAADICNDHKLHINVARAEVV